MSASRKKQLRREENKAAMTERQQQEEKETKRVRLYTRIFAVAIVLMLVVVVVTQVTSSGMIERKTTAVTVNDTEISAVELNYYYMDSINSFMNTYGSYASLLGLDTSLSLEDQYYDEENQQTWADYMLEGAISTIQSNYALYLDALDTGYEAPADLEEEIDEYMENLELYATLYGYSDTDSYLRAVYGAGSNEKTYKQYLTVQEIASHYYEDTLDALEYTDEAIRAYETDNTAAYNSYSYNYYYLAASNFYEGGTTDDEGTTTYSDEEKAAGVVACKEVADTLAQSASLEELDAAIDALEINADTTASTTAMTDTLYSSVNSTIQDWISDGSRKVGDIGVVENSTTSVAEHEHTEEEHEHEEITTVNGYYVVYFAGVNDNTFPLVNVRHILIDMEGGTTDENGNTTYSDEDKAATAASAQALLDEFLAGDATEEAFAELANANSTDTGSNTNGGLYENVYPGQMVTNFNDWCFDESRQVGDTGIVESDYGYHIMYFSGYSDLTYRDYLITADMQSEDIAAWESVVMSSVEVTTVDTSKVEKDIHLSSST